MKILFVFKIYHEIAIQLDGLYIYKITLKNEFSVKKKKITFLKRFVINKEFLIFINYIMKVIL